VGIDFWCFGVRDAQCLSLGTFAGEERFVGFVFFFKKKIRE
jgi:hypothetical protein